MLLSIFRKIYQEETYFLKTVKESIMCYFGLTVF